MNSRSASMNSPCWSSLGSGGLMLRLKGKL
jgi:hypothetical protein